MSAFLDQLRWQFVLLQRNHIISISLIVTFFYGGILYLMRDLEYIDKVLTTIAINDPTTIGLIFIGLMISTEYKNETLSALFVTPVNHHFYLITKILALSLLGTLCTLILAFLMLGFSFQIVPFTFGVFGICLLSAILGVIIISYTLEFLKFAIYSIPVILLYFNLPLLDYLEALQLGFFKYLLPGQSGISLIANAYVETPVNGELLYGYLTMPIWILLLYWMAFRIFKLKVIQR